ncbi:leucine-rich repeat-containing protein 71 isoform X2 [Zootoca vivipara]|uniref:leucine-rich repeat-containing protein 71 isoform X2 n=1 Tax=Zootoca vivipara TaxID=8524 RepID=UPI00293BFBF0|nr:leucine-rich repeat-containing protein 71 isoform X2 [Zootoca vivipara]
MGKKGERGARDKAAALEEEARNAARRAEHGEEEYQCTGILEQDFLELCTRAGFQEIPKVTLRPHPNSFAVQEEPDPLAEREWPYIIAQIQCKYAFFRPTIQVDLEHEDPKTTKEIFIRNWKIEDKMLGIFAKCLPTLSHLQAIRLWKVGLTDVTFLSLLSIVPTCSTLKTLAVEGNPMRERLYHKLISEETNLAHVSLRSNEIDDEAALLIGQALSTLKSSNKNLASINLSYNHITDVGAGYIANGLRLNRSLLSLSLAHNQIKDEGALKLAEVLGPFALTHMEVVERRRLLLEKEGQERSRLSQRHAELRSERPSSHMSNTTLDKLQTAKTTKGTVKKKEKEKEKEEEKKEKKEKELPKKDDKGQASAATAATATTAAQSKKEDSKQAKKAAPPADQKAARGKGAKSGTKDKKAQVIEVEVTKSQRRACRPFWSPWNTRMLGWLLEAKGRWASCGCHWRKTTIQWTARPMPGSKSSCGHVTPFPGQGPGWPRRSFSWRAHKKSRMSPLASSQRSLDSSITHHLNAGRGRKLLPTPIQEK